MYEKPQYLTPDGYRRKKKNPDKKKPVKKALTTKKRLPAEQILSKKKLKNQGQKGISKEAAKLIAEAIKGMLHQ